LFIAKDINDTKPVYYLTVKPNGSRYISATKKKKKFYSKGTLFQFIAHLENEAMNPMQRFRLADNHRLAQIKIFAF